MKLECYRDLYEFFNIEKSEMKIRKQSIIHLIMLILLEEISN